MCAIAGLGSLYTVSIPSDLSRLGDSAKLNQYRSIQAALSTAITLKWHRVETLKTIRVKEAIMATLLIVLLASAIV
jgi:hypothetical protein